MHQEASQVLVVGHLSFLVQRVRLVVVVVFFFIAAAAFEALVYCFLTNEFFKVRVEDIGKEGEDVVGEEDKEEGLYRTICRLKAFLFGLLLAELALHLVLTRRQEASDAGFRLHD